MAVIPVHYFAFHPEGKLKGSTPPGSPGVNISAPAHYPYTVPCRPDSDTLPKCVTVEPTSVTCEKCKATELFKQNFKPIGQVGDEVE